MHMKTLLFSVALIALVLGCDGLADDELADVELDAEIGAPDGALGAGGGDAPPAPNGGGGGGDVTPPPMGGSDTTPPMGGGESAMPPGGRPPPNPQISSVPDAVGAEIAGLETDRGPDCDGFEWIAGLRGWVVDETGAPVAGAKAQFCVRTEPGNMLICLRPSDTDAEGVFTVSVPVEARCASSAAMRVLLPGADRATNYCHVDLTSLEDGSVVLHIEAPVVLFDTERAWAIPPEGDASTSRRVIFPDGLGIDVVPSQFFGSGDGYAGLAARRIPADTPGLCFLEGQPPPDGLYAFTPEGDVFEGQFPARFPNATGLAPGTEVTLSVLGGLDCTLADGSGVEEAEWRDFGTGIVSDDGQWVQTNPDSGLPCLTWIGYRAQP